MCKGLNADIAKYNDDIKGATAARETENADYQTTHTDFSESIDALERAIAVLKKQAFDRKQACLIQVQALTSLDLIAAAAKKTIDAFLRDSDDASLDAPGANGYDFQSSGIIEMLEKLLDKFTAERTALEKEEANSKHAFDMLVQDLSTKIAQAKSDVDSNTQAKATAEGNVADTTETWKEEAWESYGSFQARSKGKLEALRKKWLAPRKAERRFEEGERIVRRYETKLAETTDDQLTKRLNTIKAALARIQGR